jgi:hypothetical protein
MNSSIESMSRTASAPFFVVSAVMEVGAGVVLLAAPDLAIRLVFGSFPPGAGTALGRLAGAALVSLGAACWLARHDGVSAASIGLVSAMLTYNAAVVALVLTGSLGPVGPLLSGAAPLHGGMALWCLLLLSGRKSVTRT